MPSNRSHFEPYLELRKPLKIHTCRQVYQSSKTLQVRCWSASRVEIKNHTWNYMLNLHLLLGWIVESFTFTCKCTDQGNRAGGGSHQSPPSGMQPSRTVVIPCPKEDLPFPPSPQAPSLCGTQLLRGGAFFIQCKVLEMKSTRQNDF